MMNIITRKELEECKPFLLLPEQPQVITISFKAFCKMTETIEHLVSCVKNMTSWHPASCMCQYCEILKQHEA